MNLSKKWFGIFVLLSIVLLGSVASIAWEGRKVLKDIAVKHIKQDTMFLTKQIENKLFELYYHAQYFSSAFDNSDEQSLLLLSNNQMVTSRLNNFVVNFKAYKRIIIFDRNGEAVAANDHNGYGKKLADVTNISEHIKNNQWFVDAMSAESSGPNQHQQTYIYGPARYVLDDDDTSYDMVLATIFKDKNKQAIGLLVSVVDFALFEESIVNAYKIISGKGWINSQLNVLDAKGNVIIDYHPLQKRKALYNRDFDILGNVNLASDGDDAAIRAISGLTGSAIDENSDDNTIKAIGFSNTNKALEDLGVHWSILIKISLEDVLFKSRNLFFYRLLILILPISILLLIAYLLIKKDITPLKQLSRGIHDLANDSNNILLPQASGNNEISKTINNLKTIQKRISDSDTLSAELTEYRVQVEMRDRAINASAVSFIVTDESVAGSPVIFVNKAFEHLTGYSLREIIGKNCRLLQGSKTQASEISKMKEAIKNQHSCTVILINYKKDGTLFHNKLQLDPVFDDNKTLTHYVGVQTDVTELVISEQNKRQELEGELDKRTKEIKESERRLRTLFDTALDGTIVIDTHGVILDVNRSLEMIFGHKRESIIGENITMLMPANYAAHHGSFMKQYLNTGQKKIIGMPRKLSAKHKTGRLIPVEISVGETLLADQKVFVGIVKDISTEEETKLREIKLESELREREFIYRTAFNQAAVGICRVSLDGSFIEVNNKLCDILAYDKNELLSLNFSKIVGSEHQEISAAFFDELLNGEKRFVTKDNLYVRKDGSKFWGTVSMSVVENADSPKYFIVIVEDISDRKRIEEELRSASERRDELLRGVTIAADAAGICHWSMDVLTRKAKWDSGMYQLYGVEEGTVLYMEDWQELLHPEDMPIIVKEFEDALATSSIFNVEYRIINSLTGNIHWVKVAGDILRNEDPNKDIVFGICTDITEEKLIQEALEKETIAAQQASKAKSQFLAVMSHEIRTPMNGVIGMIDLLKETQMKAEQRHMVSTIRNSSFSLLAIINDILDFSKIESGQMNLELIESNLLHLIESALDVLWADAEQKNVFLFVDYDFDIPKLLYLDPVRTRQVLLNLLGNAIKFSKHDKHPGLVEVYARYDKEHKILSLSIKDNGLGITKEQQGKLFKPFTQMDTSTTRKYGGTGLGLSITKSFVGLMGGYISVRSSPKKGSTFTVELPASAPDNQTLLSPFDFSNTTFLLQIENRTLSNAILSILKKLKPDNIIHDVSKKDSLNIDNTIVICDQDPPPRVTGEYKRLTLSNKASLDGKKVGDNEYMLGTQLLKPSKLVYGLTLLSGQLESEDDYTTLIGTSLCPTETIESELTILCAEDNLTNQQVLAMQLNKLGYNYKMTNNGKEALKAWQEGNYTILLTDCHMPEMDGYELTTEIRKAEKHESRPRTVIIAITADALVGKAEHCLTIGMDDYIAKPIELKELKKILTLRTQSRALKDEHLDSDNEKIIEVTDEQPPISISHLNNIIGSDDKEMINAVLSIFWETITADAVKITNALKENDAEAIRKAAHGAKGASSSSGALTLAEVLGVIEANHNNFSEVERHLEQMTSIMKSIEQFLFKEGIVTELE